jgi:PEP-CTERM motif
MNKPLISLVGSLALLATAASSSQAAIFASEVGDAGESLATAQVIAAVGGDTAIGSISGNIGLVGDTAAVDDADLYGFLLTANVVFTATATSNSSAGGVIDTALSLFDSDGNGLIFNDDIASTNTLSSISFTPTVSGLYYLGISNYSYFAQDVSNQFIFPDTSAFPGEDPTGVYAPNPAVGTLAGWRNGDAGFIGSYGTYTINLTEATAVVPEPSTTAGLLAIGFFGLHSRRRKKA